MHYSKTDVFVPSVDSRIMLYYCNCRFGIDADVPITYRVSCNSEATLHECRINGSTSHIPAGVVCKPNVHNRESMY